MYKLYRQRGAYKIPNGVYPINTLALSRDDRYIGVGTMGKTVILWELIANNDYTSYELHGHSKSVLSMIIILDNKFIISGSSDETIRFWNIMNKQQEAVIASNNGAVMSMASTADNRYLLTGGMDNKLRIWSLEERQKKNLSKSIGVKLFLLNLLRTQDFYCQPMSLGVREFGTLERHSKLQKPRTTHLR